MNNEIEQKVFRFLDNAMKKSKVLSLFMQLIFHTVHRIERAINYFKRDAYVFVNYAHRRDDETGEMRKEPDSFNIYIVRWGKAEGLWSDIEWNEHVKIINFLNESKHHAVLDMNVGMGKSSLFIPRWAKSKIVNQLEEIKKGDL